jgi:hypothetical protein
MSDLDRPEIPEPEKKTPEDMPADPEGGVNGNGPTEIPESLYLDNEKLIEWMKATDRQIKLLTTGQLLIAGSVMLLLFISVKGKPPTPPTP